MTAFPTNLSLWTLFRGGRNLRRTPEDISATADFLGISEDLSASLFPSTPNFLQGLPDNTKLTPQGKLIMQGIQNDRDLANAIQAINFSRASDATNEFRSALLSGSQALQDFPRQAAARFDEMQSTIQDLLSQLQTQSLVPDITKQAKKSASKIDEASETFQSQISDILSALEAERQDLKSKISGLVSKALGSASKAISVGQSAIDEYKDYATAAASAAAHGIRRNVEDALATIAAPGPDGIPPSPGEIESRMAQVRRQTEEQVAQAVFPFLNQTEQTLAQLRSNLAGLHLQKAQVALAGAEATNQAGSLSLQNLGLQSQVASTGLSGTISAAQASLGSLLQGQEAFLSTFDREANLTQMANSLSILQISLGAQSLSSSVNLLLNGHQTLYNMIQANPYNAIGVMDGLLTFLRLNESLRKFGGPMAGGVL